MTQAATDYAEILLKDNLSISDISAIRRQGHSSRRQGTALSTFCDGLQPEGDAKHKLAAAICRWVENDYSTALELAAGLASNSTAQYIAARCLLALGKVSEAADVLGKIAATVPSGNVYASLSLALRRSGDYAAAGAAVREGLKKVGEDPLLLAEAGILADIECDCERSVEHYHRAIKIDPDCVQALFRLAYISDLRGDNEAALDLYRRCVQVRPLHTRALVNLGLLYEEMGWREDAVECFKAVVVADPSNHRARLYLLDARAGGDMYFDEELQKRRERRNKILETPITDFELSVRSRNCLEKMNVTTLGDLTQISEIELLSFKNFGETSLMEIKRMMATKGLRLGQALEEDEQRPVAKARPPARKVDEKSRLLAKPVDELGFSVRCQHCMQTLGVATIGDLAKKTEAELLAAKNFGATSLVEVKRKLAARGLSLAGKE